MSNRPISQSSGRLERGAVGSLLAVFARRLIWLIATTHLATSCSGKKGTLPDQRVWESEHFLYHTFSDDDSVCEAVLDQLELHFDQNQEFLGFDWPSGKKIEYFKFRSEEEILNLGTCGEYPACAREGNVYSSETSHRHELTHAYMWREIYAPQFLAEGVATAMNCGAALSAWVPAWEKVVAETTDEYQSNLWQHGAWFVGHLLQHYPQGQFLDWYESVERGASALQISEAFEVVYGVSLGEVWSEATQYAGNRVQCVYLTECSAPPASTNGQSNDLAMVCDGSGEYRTIEFEGKADILFTRDEWDSFSEIVDCDGTGSRVSSPHWIEHDAELVRVESGKYFIGRSPLKTSGEMRIVEALASPMMAAGCTDAMPIPMDQLGLGTGKRRLLIDVPPGQQDEAHYVGLTAGMNREVFARTYDQPKSLVRILECEGCKTCGDAEPSWETPLGLDDDGVAMLKIVRESDSLRTTLIEVEWREN